MNGGALRATALLLDGNGRLPGALDAPLSSGARSPASGFRAAFASRLTTSQLASPHFLREPLASLLFTIGPAEKRTHLHLCTTSSVGRSNREGIRRGFPGR